MKRKLVFLCIFVLTILVLVACNSSNGGEKIPASSTGSSTDANSETQNTSEYPKGTITMIVPWSAGGGTDTGARILAPYLEEELGRTVNVINKPGGGGWIGWTELANANPDGLTIGYINSPHLMTGYLNPEFKRTDNLETFNYIGNHVMDPDVIAIHADETRFTNINELVEYAKSNKLTITATGIGTDEHLVMLDFNQNYGTQFEAVHFKGSAESQTAVLGKHVDVLIANAGEIINLHKEGEIKILGIASNERSKFISEVPTLEESGYNVFLTSSRGLAVPTGIDESVLEVLRTAFEKAATNAEQVQKLEGIGYESKYLNHEEYLELLQTDEARIKELGKILGW